MWEERPLAEEQQKSLAPLREELRTCMTIFSSEGCAVLDMSVISRDMRVSSGYADYYRQICKLYAHYHGTRELSPYISVRVSYYHWIRELSRNNKQIITLICGVMLKTRVITEEYADHYPNMPANVKNAGDPSKICRSLL